MSRFDALARGRAAAEAGMTETIRAGRFEAVTNPTTGNAERTLVVERYSGPAQWKYTSPVVGDGVQSGQTVAEQAVIVKIPTSAASLFEGDEIEVTASTADAALVGRRGTVKGSPASGQTTSHRYPVKELT